MPTDDDVLNIAMDQVYDMLVERAIAEQPDGVILSIPSNDIVSNALAQLEAAGTSYNASRRLHFGRSLRAPKIFLSS